MKKFKSDGHFKRKEIDEIVSLTTNESDLEGAGFKSEILKLKGFINNDIRVANEISLTKPDDINVLNDILQIIKTKAQQSGNDLFKIGYEHISKLLINVLDANGNIIPGKFRGKHGVAIVQAFLLITGKKNLKNSDLKVDGIFGANTLYSVLKRQKNSDNYKALEGRPDGIVNGRALRAMLKELSTGTTTPGGAGNGQGGESVPTTPGGAGNGQGGESAPTTPGGAGNGQGGENAPATPGGAGNGQGGESAPATPGGAGNGQGGENAPATPGGAGNGQGGENAPATPGGAGNGQGGENAPAAPAFPTQPRTNAERLAAQNYNIFMKNGKLCYHTAAGDRELSAELLRMPPEVFEKLKQTSEKLYLLSIAGEVMSSYLNNEARGAWLPQVTKKDKKCLEKAAKIISTVQKMFQNPTVLKEQDVDNLLTEIFNDDTTIDAPGSTVYAKDDFKKILTSSDDLPTKKLRVLEFFRQYYNEPGIISEKLEEEILTGEVETKNEKGQTIIKKRFVDVNTLLEDQNVLKYFEETDFDVESETSIMGSDSGKKLEGIFSKTEALDAKRFVEGLEKSIKDGVDENTLLETFKKKFQGATGKVSDAYIEQKFKEYTALVKSGKTDADTTKMKENLKKELYEDFDSATEWVMSIVKEIKKAKRKIGEMSAEEKKKVVENMRKIGEKGSDQELLKKFMSTQKKVRTDNALRSGMIKGAINTHPEWRQQDKFIDMYGSVKGVGFWEMSDEKRMAYTEALTRGLLATAITAGVGGAVVGATSFGLRLAGAAAFIESTSNAAIIGRSVLFGIEFYGASQFTANIIQGNSLTNGWNNVHEIGKSVLLFLIMGVGAKYGEGFLKKVFGQGEIREFTAAAISRAAEGGLLWATPNLIEQIIFRNDVERRGEDLVQALMLTMVVMPLTQKGTKFVVEKHKGRVELNARLNLGKLEGRNFIETTETKIKDGTFDEAASLTEFQRIYKEAKGKEPTPEIEGKYKELVEAIKANDTAKVEKLKGEFDNIFDYKEPKKTKEQILEAKKSGKEFVDGLEERIKAGEEETALLEEFKTKYKESTGKELPKKLEHTFTEYVKAVKNGYDAMKIDNKKALDKIFKYKEPKRSKEQFLEAKKANKTFVNNIEELVKRGETKEGLLDQYRISYKDITGKELPKELENKFTEYIEAIEAGDNAKMESLKKELEKPFEDTRKIWWRRRKEFRAEKAENIKEAKNFLDELNEEVKPGTVIVDMEILVTEFKTKYESATGKEITPGLEKLFKQYVDEINKGKTTEAAIDKEILKRAISGETRITDEFKGQLVTYMQEIETKIKNGSETRSSEELAQDFATKFKEITGQDAKIFPDLFKLFLEDLRNGRTVEAEKLKNDLEKSFDTLEIVEPKISWINKITNKFKGFIEKGRNLFQKIKEFIKSLRTKAIDGRRTDLEITEKGILDVYKENYKEIFGKDMPGEKVTELEGLAKEYVEKVKSGKGEEAEQVIYKMEEVRKEFENGRKQSMLESFLEDYRQETGKEFPSEELPELKTLIDEYVEAQNTGDAVRAKQILDEIKLSGKEIIELSEPIFDEIQSGEYINQEFKDLFGKLKKRNSFVFDPMEFPGVDNINIKTNINGKDIYFAPKRGFKNGIEITCGYYFENGEIKTLNLEKPFFGRKSDGKIIDEQLGNLIDNFSFDPKLVETIETRNGINLIRGEGVKTRIKKFFEFREPERYSIPGDGGNGELSKKVTVNGREITVNESRFDIALNSSSAGAVKSVEELTTKIIIDGQEFFFKESRLDNSGEQKVVGLRLNNGKLEIAEFVKTEQGWNLKKGEKLVPVDDNLGQTFDSFEEFKPTITETAPTPEVAPIQSIETKSIGTGKEVGKEYGNHITKNRVNDEVARKEILNMGLDPEEFGFNADIKIDTNIGEFYLNTKPERCLLPESDARRNNYNPGKILSYRMSEGKVSVVEITKTEHGWEAKEGDNSYKLDEIFESTLNDNFNK